MIKTLPQQIDDPKVWQEFKAGNIRAFNQIYNQYYKIIYNYGYNIFADKDFIKDNLQELFFEIWRDKANLGDVKSIKFYLLISFRRKVLYNLNKQRKALKKNVDYTQQELEPYNESYEQGLIDRHLQKVQHQYITQIIQTLPERQKEAIYLKFYQDLSYQEIMEVMSLKYQTVRDLIYKALKTLRKRAAFEKIAL